jgi:hypothetical protein
LRFFGITSFFDYRFVSSLYYVPAFGGFWNFFNNVGFFRYWVRFFVYYVQASGFEFAISGYMFGLSTVVAQVFFFIFFFSLFEGLSPLLRLSRGACLLLFCIIFKFIGSLYLRFFIPLCFPFILLYRKCHPAFLIHLSYRWLSS